MKPRVSSLTLTTKLPRSKRQIGDRKVVDGQTYVWRQVMIKSGPERGCYLVNNGKPVCEWMTDV